MSLGRFLHYFWINIFLLLYSITWPNCIAGSLYFVGYWAIYVLQLFANQVVASQILKLTLSFLSSRFFYMTKNSRQKFKIPRMKWVFKMKLKALFFLLFSKSCLKGGSLYWFSSNSDTHLLKKIVLFASMKVL